MKKLFIILFVFITATAAAQSKMAVIASGYGADEATALKQAYSAAVEQAVGVLVTSEVYIENGQLIRDKILTKSSGFIENIEKLYSGLDGNTHKVTIKAQVSKEKLNQELMKVIPAAATDTIAFDGAAMAARAVTGKQQQNALLEELPGRLSNLENRLINTMRVKVESTEFFHKNMTPDGLIPYMVKVKIYGDEKEYQKISDELNSLVVQANREIERDDHNYNVHGNRVNFDTYLIFMPFFRNVKNVTAQTQCVLTFEDKSGGVVLQDTMQKMKPAGTFGKSSSGFVYGVSSNLKAHYNYRSAYIQIRKQYSLSIVRGFSEYLDDSGFYDFGDGESFETFSYHKPLNSAMLGVDVKSKREYEHVFRGTISPVDLEKVKKVSAKLVY